MLPEVLVFNRNEGSFHQWWNLIVSNDDSVLLGKRTDHGRVVIRINLGDHGRPLVIESRHLGQVAAVDEQHPGGGTQRHRQGEKDDENKGPQVLAGCLKLHLVFDFQYGEKRFLWNVDSADALHPLLSLFLLFK